MYMNYWYTCKGSFIYVNVCLQDLVKYAPQVGLKMMYILLGEVSFLEDCHVCLGEGENPYI